MAVTLNHNAQSRHQQLQLFVELIDFHGRKMGALWEDIKFDAKHFSDVEHISVVEEKRWREMMATFSKQFTSAKIHCFESFEIDMQRDWLSLDTCDHAVPVDLPGVNTP